MYKKSSCLDQKTGSVSNYMEYAFNFMPNYLHLTSFFVHGETFNQQEPMIFCQFASVGGRVYIFMLVHFDCMYTFGQI